MHKTKFKNACPYNFDFWTASGWLSFSIIKFGGSLEHIIFIHGVKQCKNIQKKIINNYSTSFDLVDKIR